MDKKINLSLITERGCIKEASQELEERFLVKGIKEDSENALVFEATQEMAVEIMYSSQSAKRILWFIGSSEFNGYDDFLSKIEKMLSGFTLKEALLDQTYRIECERVGDHEFNSMEVETEIAAIIFEKAKNRVDLKNPDIILHVNILDERFIIGLDLAGRDLSKRQYRVFNTFNAVKGTIGFCLLLFSGMNRKSSIVDPFCLSGTMPIEAALYSAQFPVNHYDKRFSIMNMKYFESLDAEKLIQKMDEKIIAKAESTILCVDSQFRNIIAAKKNAKIAGIDKLISFSRNDVDWLDIKIDKNSISILATRPIEPSKNISEGIARKAYSQLFNRSKIFLKEDAVMSFIVNNYDVLLDEAEKYGYALKNKKQVFQGKQPLWFISIAKN